MTPDEQIAVIRAKADGKEIEKYYIGLANKPAFPEWEKMNEYEDFNFKWFSYRIKNHIAYLPFNYHLGLYFINKPFYISTDKENVYTVSRYDYSGIYYFNKYIREIFLTYEDFNLKCRFFDNTPCGKIHV